MSASTQPAIETLADALRFARDCISSPDTEYAPGKDIYDQHMMMRAMRRIDAAAPALSAVEADLRRKDGMIEDAKEHILAALDAPDYSAMEASVRDARAALNARPTPVSPSEPVPQQAEEER